MHAFIEHPAGKSLVTESSVPFYDALWTRTKRADQHHKCRMHVIDRLLAALPPLDHPRRILELGCGSGIVSEFLAAHGEVTGVDQSPVGIEKARSRCQGTFIVGTLPELSVPGEFDLCVLTQVIEHFNDRDQVRLLQNARRVVRAGGHLIVTTPNRPVASRVYLRPGEPEPIENWLALDGLQSLLRQTGWEPGTTRFAFSFLPVLASRYQLARAARFLMYDVLRLRTMIEDLTSPLAVGDCVAVLATARRDAQPAT